MSPPKRPRSARILFLAPGGLSAFAGVAVGLRGALHLRDAFRSIVLPPCCVARAPAASRSLFGPPRDEPPARGGGGGRGRGGGGGGGRGGDGRVRRSNDLRTSVATVSRKRNGAAASMVYSADAPPGETLVDKAAIENALSEHHTATSPPPLILLTEPEAEDTAEAAHLTLSSKKRCLTEDTKRKIAYSMLGQRKSDEMRAKVSEKLKGRVPWNKGKKLSPETRARMSEARVGTTSWNKGRRLSPEHRLAISSSAVATNRTLCEDTRMRLRMARRRPGDGIVAGGPSPDIRKGSYPLVETVDIHGYITLRRELRVWSDRWHEQNGKRPSLADVRRTARPRIVRKFEQYVAMRDRIRGLAADVYGSLDPMTVPAVNPRDVSYGPRNNNSGFYAGEDGTIFGERSRNSGSRGPVVDDREVLSEDNYRSIGRAPATPLIGASSPSLATLRGDYSSGFQVRDSLHVGRPGIPDARTAPPGPMAAAGQVGYVPTASDFRAIGKYRLMESIEISKYVETRRELAKWSNGFKTEYGHVPALSDVRDFAAPETYRKFCDYVENRERISGLVEEVCGTRIDNEEEIRKVADTGRTLVDQLNLRTPDVVHARRLSMRSPPHALQPDE